MFLVTTSYQCKHFKDLYYRCVAWAEMQQQYSSGIISPDLFPSYKEGGEKGLVGINVSLLVAGPETTKDCLL